MVCSSCYVPGCKSGYTSDRQKCKIIGRKPASLFKAPKNDLLFEKWKIALPCAGKEFMKNNCVCELHFAEDDIRRYYVTKVFDGKVNKILRGTPVLKPEAVPYIFPTLPGYVSEHPSRCKMATVVTVKGETCRAKRARNRLSRFQVKKTYSSTKKVVETIEGNSETNEISLSKDMKSDTNSQVFETVDTEEPNDSLWDDMKTSTGREALQTVNVEISTPNKISQWEDIGRDTRTEIVSCIELIPFSFDYLVQNCHTIVKPTQWWGLTSTPNYIICARWDAEYIAERRVVIEQDLHFKVFFKDSQIVVPDDKEIGSIDDVSQLLREVDETVLCAGFQQQYHEKCLLYLPKGENSRGKYSAYCSECKRLKKRLDEYGRRQKRRSQMSDLLYQYDLEEMDTDGEDEAVANAIRNFSAGICEV